MCILEYSACVQIQFTKNYVVSLSGKVCFQKKVEVEDGSRQHCTALVAWFPSRRRGREGVNVLPTRQHVQLGVCSRRPSQTIRTSVRRHFHSSTRATSPDHSRWPPLLPMTWCHPPWRRPPLPLSMGPPTGMPPLWRARPRRCWSSRRGRRQTRPLWLAMTSTPTWRRGGSTMTRC